MNTEAVQSQIAKKLNAMELPELRAKYAELYGEESRAGAQFLRKKIAFVMVRDAEKLEIEQEVDQEIAASTTESTAVSYAEQAVAAEEEGNFEDASGLWMRASAASRARKDEYRDRSLKALSEHRKRTPAPAAAPARKPLFGGRPRPKLDPPRSGEPSLEDDRKHLMHLQRQVAEKAEARGDLEAAADAWGLYAQLDLEDSAEYLKRSSDLRALAREKRMAPKEETPPLAAADKQDGQAHIDRRIPPVGTVLERVYKGQNVVVSVAENGFVLLFGGEPTTEIFRSLSGVARHVTGKNTNGFAFFNLVEQPKGMSAADGAVVKKGTAALANIKELASQIDISEAVADASLGELLAESFLELSVLTSDIAQLLRARAKGGR